MSSNSPINIQPNGWSFDQLQALNDLSALYDAYVLVTQLKNAFNDTSPQAAKVQADILALGAAKWAQLKTFPT